MSKPPAKKRRFNYIPRQQTPTNSYQPELWRKGKNELHDIPIRDEQRLTSFLSLLEDRDPKEEKAWTNRILRDLDVNTETFKVCGLNSSLCNIIIDYLIRFPTVSKLDTYSKDEQFPDRDCMSCRGEKRSITSICLTISSKYTYCHIICAGCDPEFEKCIRGKIITYPELDKDYKLYLLWNGLIDFVKYYIKY